MANKAAARAAKKNASKKARSGGLLQSPLFLASVVILAISLGYVLYDRMGGGEVEHPPAARESTANPAVAIEHGSVTPLVGSLVNCDELVADWVGEHHFQGYHVLCFNRVDGTHLYVHITSLVRELMACLLADCRSLPTCMV